MDMGPAKSEDDLEEQVALKKTIAQQHDEVGGLQMKNDTLADQIKQLEASLASLKVDKCNMKSAIANLHQENSDLRNSQTNGDTDSLQMEFHVLQEKVAALEEEKRQLEAARNDTLKKVAALEEEKRQLEVAHNDVLKKKVATLEEEKRQLDAAHQKAHAENSMELVKVKNELQQIKTQVEENDVLGESEKLKRQLEENAANVKRLQTTVTDCEESLAQHIAVSEGKSKTIEKLEKQAAPTKEKLAAIEKAYSRLEGQMKSLSIDRESEKATAKKLTASIENERATFAEEKQKLQKKNDMLSKDLENQKQAFWDAATAAGAAGSENVEAGNNKAEELKQKVVNLENKLKESKKEQDILRCRAKDAQTEMLKHQKKTKTLEKAQKESVDTKAISSMRAADEESPQTAQDQMRVALSKLGGAHYAIVFAVVCLGIKVLS
eukprot:GEMP01034876.1.p1 GENE.GEMP01034876.1~~GEMP01034876.1.p1  ORF type:complete len:437 (+),score=148.52 GEMP01034876.1:36-1346(+)